MSTVVVFLGYNIFNVSMACFPISEWEVPLNWKWLVGSSLNTVTSFANFLENLIISAQQERSFSFSEVNCQSDGVTSCICFIFFTARNEVAGRLCFYTCLSVILFTGMGRAWQGEGVHAPLPRTPRDTTRCGQWAGGTHPTGMHSWLHYICLIQDWVARLLYFRHGSNLTTLPPRDRT